MIHLEMSDPTVKLICKTAFPDLNWKRVWAYPGEKVQFHGTNWDEGRKREYRIVELATMKTVSIQQANWLNPANFYEQKHEVPDGFVVVVACFVYKVDHFEIFAPASAITPMITQAPELTYAEKVVLVATRSLKASYNGIPNLRFHENRGRVTLQEWETAKASLIEKKFLNKAGAITVAGRNACPQDYPTKMPAIA
ncbi:MAG: hypothetical protein E6Q36_01305 [Chryseobacterium sp.]|nr:MAG: hypothetical protein E6Q36_01305 [Chryseobacterium sp.]